MENLDMKKQGNKKIMRHKYNFSIDGIEILMLSDTLFDEPFYSTLPRFVPLKATTKLDILIYYFGKTIPSLEKNQTYELISQLPFIKVFKNQNSFDRYTYKFLFYAKEKETSEKLLLNTALCSSDFREIIIYGYESNLKRINHSIVNPILTSVGSTLVLSCFMRLNGIGVGLHASAVIYNNKAVVFTGPSGAGKSTMRDIWQGFGHSVIGNDRVIIDFNTLSCCGTPYERTKDWVNVQNFKIKAIFYLSHGDTNIISDVSDTAMMYSLFKQCIVPVWFEKGIQQTLAQIQKIINDIPVFSFSFKPNESAYNCCLKFLDTKV